MNALTTPLTELESISQTLKELKSSGIVEINGFSDAAKLHTAHTLSDGFTHKIIVTFSEQRAKEICEEYSFYDKNVYMYPARDLIFYQADIHGNLLTKERLKVLKQIVNNEP